MINVTVVGDRELISRMNQFSPSLERVLTKRMVDLVLLVKRRVQDKLSGPVLRVRTGALRRSITTEVRSGTDRVSGRIFSAGDVKYAAIHEFGGRTPAHVIEPRNAQALSFMMGGSRVFARRVNHPGSQMPERSFMRSTLTEMKGQIISSLSKGIVQVALGGQP